MSYKTVISQRILFILYTFNRESKNDSTFIKDNNVLKYIIHFTTQREYTWQ